MTAHVHIHPSLLGGHEFNHPEEWWDTLPILKGYLRPRSPSFMCMRWSRAWILSGARAGKYTATRVSVLPTAVDAAQHPHQKASQAD